MQVIAMDLKIIFLIFSFLGLSVGLDTPIVPTPGSVNVDLPIDLSSTTTDSSTTVTESTTTSTASTTTPSTSTSTTTTSTTTIPTTTTTSPTTTTTTPTTTSTAASTTASTTTSTAAATTSIIPTTASTTSIVPGLCEKAGIFCQDCKTLKICSQTGAFPAQTVSCMNQNMFAPYCDFNTNQCTSANTCAMYPMAYPGSLSYQQTTSCIKQERRPDPLNCGQYVECVPNSNGNTFTGYVVQCPLGQNYCPQAKTCGNFVPCQDIKFYCFGKSGIMTQFTGFPSIYGYCPRLGTAEQYLVYECRGDYIFDTNIAQCGPVCSQEGPIVRNENCKQFYYCSRSLFSFTMTLNNCPSGFGFNPLTKMCDPNYGNCTPLSP